MYVGICILRMKVGCSMRYIMEKSVVPAAGEYIHSWEVGMETAKA